MLRHHPGEVAGIIQAPNYALWAEQLNAKGGLMVKGEGRRPIEYVSFDDRSHLAVARLEPHCGPASGRSRASCTMPVTVPAAAPAREA